MYSLPFSCYGYDKFLVSSHLRDINKAVFEVTEVFYPVTELAEASLLDRQTDR